MNKGTDAYSSRSNARYNTKARFKKSLHSKLERDGGIEPPTEDWKSAVLPLN